MSLTPHHGPKPEPHLIWVEDFHPPVAQSPGAWTRVASGGMLKWRGSGHSTSGAVLYTSGSGSGWGFGSPASTRAPGRPNAGISDKLVQQQVYFEKDVWGQ